MNAFSHMSPDLNLSHVSLASRRSLRWEQVAPGVLPSAVAEMDFSAALPIQQAIQRLARDRDYGYPCRSGGDAEAAIRSAFAERMASRFRWHVSEGNVHVTTDIVQATIAAVIAFTEPGDGVLLHTPCYPPFRKVVEQAGRRLVECPLIIDGSCHRFDPDAFREAAAEARLLILCNPHNPTGRVFTHRELVDIARVAVDRELVILSDEIHADIVFDGAHHIPIATLDDEVAARTVTANSPSKSFNIPGLRCAAMHFGSAPLLQRFRSRVPELLLGRPSVFGIDAFVAAWSQCEPWFDQVLSHLHEMRDLVVETIRSEMPQLLILNPQATFLAWIDCSAMNWKEPAAKRFLDQGRIAFSPGENFCPRHVSHVRLNFGTSRSILTEILERMTTTVRHG